MVGTATVQVAEVVEEAGQAAEAATLERSVATTVASWATCEISAPRVLQLVSSVASRAIGAMHVPHYDRPSRPEEVEHLRELRAEEEAAIDREMGDERGQVALEVVVPITREVGVSRADIRDRDVDRCMLWAQFRTQRGTLSTMMQRLQM